MGGIVGGQGSTGVGLARVRLIGLFVLTSIFVGVKAVSHDAWAVGFGLAVLALLLLTPESTEEVEPWRKHALRVVSACFVVVTVASIVVSLTGGFR
jgi:hypothetical protein